MNTKNISKLLLLGSLILLILGRARAQSVFNINLDVIRNSVVFLHEKDADGKLIGGGTAFMLVVPSKASPGFGYYVLVTARHIADPPWANCPAITGTLFVVFNTKANGPAQSGSAVEIPLINPVWSYPSDDSADVAVTVIDAQYLVRANVENSPVNIAEAATLDEAKKVDTGAQIVSAGLLLGASGERRNYPIFKFGYVSSKPDEPIGLTCIPGAPPKQMTEWMIAASLVPGNSGSPIYYVPPGGGIISVTNQRAALLGVQSMSFLGSDVAGMTPVRFLVDAIRRYGVADMDFGKLDADLKQPVAAPTSDVIKPGPVPIPSANPKQ